MAEAEFAYLQGGEAVIEMMKADSSPQLDAMIVNRLADLDCTVQMVSVTLRLVDGTFLYEYGPDNQMVGLRQL